MDYHTMRYIATIARCATLYHDERLKRVGLSPYQSPYIPVVCRCPGIMQDQIARELHVHCSSVTRQLAALEAAGFVTRRRSSDDRRAVEVYPTEKACKVLPAVREGRQRWRALLLEGLSETEKKALDTQLANLAQRAEELVRLSQEEQADREALRME